MKQPILGVSAAETNADLRIERFRRYAQGRIGYFKHRQLLTIVGCGYLAYAVSPIAAFVALFFTLIGEGVDCRNLNAQLRRLKAGRRFHTASRSAVFSASFQSACIAACIFMAALLPKGGHGMHFGFVFLMSAVLNAGLVWPHHRPSALARLAVYGMTFVALGIAQYRHPQSTIENFVADVLSMMLMCYIVFAVLQFVISNYARQSESAQKYLIAAKALEAADRERRASQDQARMLSLVAQHANDSIVISGPSGIINWVNEAFSTITGYAQSEAIGKRPSDFLNAPETDEMTTQAIAQSVTAGKPIRAEILNKRKDGENIWVETNIVPIKAGDGSVEMIVAIERDISDVKLHEEELAKAKILAEKGERSKAEFLATMSHEIRTPMNGIVGLSDLLAELALPAEAQKYATTIRQSADALLGIINDILDVSKLEVGRLTIDPVEFDLRACFRSSIDLFGPQIAKKGIYLDVEEEQVLPTRVIGDDGRLRQVLLNMIGNAVKFTAQGGVTVNASIEEAKDYYTFSVKIRDTGIGIAQERLALIFNKFEQADGKTTRKYGGTGLGLSISQQLVQLMGGEIVANSEVGEGSVFSLSFKFEKPKSKEQSEEKPRLDADEIDAIDVLVAEDNKTNRFLIRKYLEDLPLALEFAHDGREAVEMTRARRPDVIFMDMSMPEMDGLEATNHIRTLPGPRPLIIALTANAFESDRKACFEVGMDDFLAKPIKKSDLIQKLAQFSVERRAKPL